MDPNWQTCFAQFQPDINLIAIASTRADAST
jgi:hypothetical protein